jgi:hypothetical protein
MLGGTDAHRRSPGFPALTAARPSTAYSSSRRLPAIDASPGSVLSGAVFTIRTVADALMSSAGVDPDEAFDAVLEGVGEFEVPAPPPTPRTPFSSRGRASG